MADLPFRPLGPGEKIDNPDGSYSTEKTITIQLRNGKWVNIPTIYMMPDGIQDFSDRPELAERLGVGLMEQFGYQFPTFDNVESAEMAARYRSEQGGVYSSIEGQGANGFPDLSTLFGAHLTGRK